MLVNAAVVLVRVPKLNALEVAPPFRVIELSEPSAVMPPKPVAVFAAVLLATTFTVKVSVPVVVSPPAAVPPPTLLTFQ